MLATEQERSQQRSDVFSHLIDIVTVAQHTTTADGQALDFYTRRNFHSLITGLKRIQQDSRISQKAKLGTSKHGYPKLEFYLPERPQDRVTVTVKDNGLTLSYDRRKSGNTDYTSRVGIKLSQDRFRSTEGRTPETVGVYGFAKMVDFPVPSTDVTTENFREAVSFFGSLYGDLYQRS